MTKPNHVDRWLADTHERLRESDSEHLRWAERNLATDPRFDCVGFYQLRLFILDLLDERAAQESPRKAKAHMKQLLERAARK